MPADADHRPSPSGPGRVRSPRGTGPGVAVQPTLDTLPIGKAELRRRGARVALLAFGAIVPAAEQVGAELGLTVVDIRFVRPLDRALLLELAKTHDGFATLEDNVVAGGAGSGVAELLAAEGIAMPMLHLGLPDAFQHHASREQFWPRPGSTWTASAPRCSRAGPRCRRRCRRPAPTRPPRARRAERSPGQGSSTA